MSRTALNGSRHGLVLFVEDRRRCLQGATWLLSRRPVDERVVSTGFRPRSAQMTHPRFMTGKPADQTSAGIALAHQ
jgi:hypothetical protein